MYRTIRNGKTNAHPLRYAGSGFCLEPFQVLKFHLLIKLKVTKDRSAYSNQHQFPIRNIFFELIR